MEGCLKSILVIGAIAVLGIIASKIIEMICILLKLIAPLFLGLCVLVLVVLIIGYLKEKLFG